MEETRQILGVGDNLTALQFTTETSPVTAVSRFHNLKLPAKFLGLINYSRTCQHIKIFFVALASSMFTNYTYGQGDFQTRDRYYILCMGIAFITLSMYT